MIDLSLQVCSVKLGSTEVGTLQSIDVDHHMQSIDGLRGGQHMFLSQGSTLTLTMLMTREQKVLYAVITRLVPSVQLSVELHDGIKYLIKGTSTLPAEVLKEFAEKKHADHEVQFIFENASLEVMKERKHGKSTVH